MREVTPVSAATARGLSHRTSPRIPDHHMLRLPWNKILAEILPLVLGLMTVKNAVVSAQEVGSCADLGLSVIEPISVAWEADFTPVLNPDYLWAYGDVDLLWDDDLSCNDYWFHWFDAVPGPDAYVIYHFQSGTNVEGVQWTNDWSQGDLQLQGLDGNGQPVGGQVVVPLSDPFVSHVALLDPISAVLAVKMSTSTQDVKLCELDFCGALLPPPTPSPVPPPTPSPVTPPAPAPVTPPTPSTGTCADLGLSVVEPISVAWEADFTPVLNPDYLWAYGDVDVLWDDDLCINYWFHWFDAVPGPDAYVVYHFQSGTNVEGVQWTNDWSDGDLQLQGLDDDGQPVGGQAVMPLSDPFVSHVVQLGPMSVAAVKMTTSTQQVKLYELDFCGEANIDPPTPAPVPDPAPAPVAPPTPDTGCGSDNDPADGWCGSVNVIDSFGDVSLPQGANTGARWDTVTEYYNKYGNRPGMCSIEVHNKYWTAVRAADGGLTYFPSWHPPVHDLGGPEECRFTHEHGLDPRTSDLYDEDHPTNIGAPFGFVHPGSGVDNGDRVEDHVGHKVVVENDIQLTTNNPYNGIGNTLNLFLKDGQPVTCDWYSKLHQGTHSSDALGFNLHEYHLNYACDDGTEARIKEMTDFGFEIPADVNSPPFPLSGGSGTVSGDNCGWFSTNFPGPTTDPDPSGDSDFGDAKRSFTCLMGDAKIEELWKPSAFLSAPDGAATLAYDPYYVVMNSNRYGLYQWWDYLDQDGDYVGENAMISMVDFCVDGTELRNELMRPQAPSNFVKDNEFFTGPFRVQTYCNSIDPSILSQWEQDIVDAGGDDATLMSERKESIHNVFLGTRRGVHTKGPVMYGSNSANFGLYAFFCTDTLGNESTWPTNPSTGQDVTPSNPWSSGDPIPVCDGGEVSQLLSPFNNNHGPVEGSTAGATVSGGVFLSNGPAGEIVIDMDALYPGHGIQAPN